MADFWFNVGTGQVEEGHQSEGSELMGPYGSREEAANALATAKKNTEKWDAEDKAWDEG